MGDETSKQPAQPSVCICAWPLPPKAGSQPGPHVRCGRCGLPRNVAATTRPALTTIKR